MLEIKPILSELWRHKLSVLLIVLQLGLALTIISNSLALINERNQKMARPTGIAVEDIVTFHFMPILKDYDMMEAFRLDMDMIRSLPSVAGATISRAPLTTSGSSAGFNAEPNHKGGATRAAIFWGDEHFIGALGMQLVAGRTFTPGEIRGIESANSQRPTTAIVTQRLANKLFANDAALGKPIYYGGEGKPIEVVGIVKRNLGPWPNAPFAGNAIFLPGVVDTQWFDYIVRAEPGQRDAILKLVEEKLTERDPRRVIESKTLEEQLDRSYAADNTMVTVLSGVVGVLTFIVTLGIVGLTVFWITQRQKQIGVRRALGATRSAIVRYFLLENLLIAAPGIALGLAAAQIFNHFLVSEFDQSVLPLSITLASALMLLVISLAAALVPALRAANTSPAMATRSV